MLRRVVVTSLAALLASAMSLAMSESSVFAADASVLDPPYNAAGDGVSNDRAAIQSAIDAVHASGGGSVHLPGGHTYLTGDLSLKSNVTLNIHANAVVQQSQTTGDYAHPPTRGRVIPGSSVPFITYLDQNYPLIYAGNATNVAITGGGKIQMTYVTSDADSILVHAIGFHQVSGYVISNVTIAGACAYNITVRNTDHGEISGVTTTSPRTLNSDGISLMNSSHLRVHDNHLTTFDDGIYVWASYDDPRRSAWWNSDTLRPSTDIEVDHNVVDNQATNGSHGFLFINWTAGAPDQSQVEVSRIHVHDNTLRAPFPVAALNQDIYHPQNQKTPSKWLTFRTNLLQVAPGSTPPGAVSKGLAGMATTDFVGDDPAYNFGLSTNTTGLYNSNFDAANAFSTEFGTSFWSTEGAASAPDTQVGQPAGRYGQIAGFHQGYASISQGVYLAAGTYVLGAATQSSGANIRMFAIQGSPLAIVASTTFNNTAWQTQTLTFTVTTPGNYRLGVDNAGAGSSATAFGRIDNVTLTKTN